MPTKIVDLSARSQIIYDEPFPVHFWECIPNEYLDYLVSPRVFLGKMGIQIPEDCRIETSIENHDWIGTNAPGLRNSNGTIICNVGSGNVARSVYRVISYGHDHSTVGKFDKDLLHSCDEQEMLPKSE
mgnify:CR=1 FL=1